MDEHVLTAIGIGAFGGMKRRAVRAPSSAAGQRVPSASGDLRRLDGLMSFWRRALVRLRLISRLRARYFRGRRAFLYDVAIVVDEPHLSADKHNRAFAGPALQEPKVSNSCGC